MNIVDYTQSMADHNIQRRAKKKGFIYIYIYYMYTYEVEDDNCKRKVLRLSYQKLL